MTDTDVAVIGMSVRVPDAENPRTFWDNIRSGRESVRRFSNEELRARGVPEQVLANANYVPVGAPLPNLDLFDAEFFGFSPADAALLDPQVRIFLECAWEAFEDGGHTPGNEAGPVGVFASAGMNTYLLFEQGGAQAFSDPVDWFRVLVGASTDFIATRVSYKLNLRGPSMTVQTACSSSLVALHLAVQSLLARECDMALAGGVAVKVFQEHGYFHFDGSVFSPDGRCRAFDAEARGTAIGNGAGAVLLRRLGDAVRDGDRVYAVIKGSAVNNDGADKIGYTAPSPTGQAAVIAEALSVAGVSADSIGYVETHGTGTPLGDPIEISALTQVFRRHTARRQYCAIGSVKPNIGHLDCAAGISSFIKTVLAVNKRELPPMTNFTAPNPQIPFAESPFVIPTELSEWKSDAPRRAGVSSFGIGGTNVHVIVEEAPAPVMRAAPADAPKLLLLSARTPGALDKARQRLASALELDPELRLDDVAYTLAYGRVRFDERLAVACSSREEAIALLRSGEHPETPLGHQRAPSPPIVMAFPGQGGEYPGMSRQLYELLPAFRQQVDDCLAILEGECSLDLRPVLYPSEGEVVAAQRAFEDPTFIHTAVFVVEYALAKVLLGLGVEPRVLIGHSLGEYVAACLAGVFSSKDALRMVAARGRLMLGTSPGGMLAVEVPAANMSEWIAKGLSVAVINDPESCVMSGPIAGIAELEAWCAASGVMASRINANRGFHSSLLDPILSEFAATVKTVTFRPPDRVLFSTITGEVLGPAQACDPDYWVRHMRNTVRLDLQLDRLAQAMPDCALLAMGPVRFFGRAMRRARQKFVQPESTPLLRDASEPQRDDLVLARALGALWVRGGDLDLSRMTHLVGGRRTTMPTYPFEHRRHWVRSRARSFLPENPIASPAAGTLAEMASDSLTEGGALHAEPSGEYRDDLIALVESVWAEVLGISSVPRSVSFLHLGGDSVLAAKAASRLTAALTVRVSIRVIIEAPSLVALAAKLETLVTDSIASLSEVDAQRLLDAP